MRFGMQGEVRHLKEQLALQEESRSPSIAGTDNNMANMHPEGVNLFDTLVSSIHNNVAERINLQKALFEVQDADVRTRMQLEALLAQNSARVCLLSTLTVLPSPHMPKNHDLEKNICISGINGWQC